MEKFYQARVEIGKLVDTFYGGQTLTEIVKQNGLDESIVTSLMSQKQNDTIYRVLSQSLRKEKIVYDLIDIKFDGLTYEYATTNPSFFHKVGYRTTYDDFLKSLRVRGIF